MSGEVRTAGSIGAAAGTRGALQGEGTKLRPCPDCGHQVSLLASSCPSCGRPLGPSPRAREGPFLQTLNAGCMLVAWGFVAMIVGGFVLTVLELIGYIFKLGR